jgi:hypothetical protein
MLCLMEYPDQHARLYAMPELLPSAIEEVLRSAFRTGGRSPWENGRLKRPDAGI